MMPILFQFPGTGIKIFGFGTMLFVAFLASMSLAVWRARKENLDPEIIYDLSTWVFVGGLLGARLLFVWSNWGREDVQSFWDVFKVWKGGITFYGSIIGGTIGFFLNWYRRRFPLLATLDTIAPAVAIGVFFGRLGCFLNGCCHGDVCSLPWAVTFPAESGPWSDQVHQGLITARAAHSLPVHPTQLYSSLDGLILLALLTAFYPIRRRDGEVMALMMVAYPIMRFFNEILRDDDKVFAAGLTLSQLVSVLVLVGGLAFWAWLRRWPTVRYADHPRQSIPAAA